MKRRQINKYGKKNKYVSRVLVLRLFQYYYFIGFVISTLIISYTYFLLMSVYHTAIAKSQQFQIVQIESEIADSEAKYMNEYQQIKPEILTADFVVISSKNKKFVKSAQYLGMAQ